MKRQRGQTLVEFALIAPLMFLMIFGMIYGGAMFMQYLNMSNEVRTIARTIAIRNSETERQNLINSYGAKSTFASFYEMKRTIECTYYPNEEGTEDKKNPKEIIVKVTFKRDNKDLPWILYKIGFPPEEIKPIEYHMKAEKYYTGSNSNTEDDDTDT